jgi:NADPH2:quinone reductase
MKSIRVHEFGGPEVLKLEDVTKPIPGKGEVLVAVKAIGVNPVETYLRSGSNPKLPRPYTPGLDAAGIVEAVGEGGTDVKESDRVYTADSISGSYAEFTLCQAGDVHKLPDNISFEEAAGLNIPYATAYRALFQKAKAQPGETVFVHGASGGVGTAAIQWCKLHGIRVIGTGGSDEGRKLAREQGADEVLDHRSPTYLEELTGLTNGRGPDVILEMLSNVNLGKDLGVLAPNGRIVIIGSRGKVEIAPRDAMSREAAIFGLMLFNASPAEFRAIHAAIYAGLKNGALRPIVGKKFPLAKAAEAHQAVLAPGAYGKIILIP